MDGLEAIAHVGQRAADDDAHRVVEVGALQLLLDGHGHDPPADLVVRHARLPLKRSPCCAMARSGSWPAEARTACRDAIARLVEGSPCRRRHAPAGARDGSAAVSARRAGRRPG